MAEKTVSIKLKVKDEASKEIKKVGDSALDLNRKVGEIKFSDVARAARLATVAFAATTGALVALAAASVKGGTASKDFTTGLDALKKQGLQTAATLGEMITRNQAVIDTMAFVRQGLADVAAWYKQNEGAAKSMIRNGIVFVMDSFSVMIDLIQFAIRAYAGLKIAFNEIQVAALKVFNSFQWIAEKLGIISDADYQEAVRGLSESIAELDKSSESSAANADAMTTALQAAQDRIDTFSAQLDKGAIPSLNNTATAARAVADGFDKIAKGASSAAEAMKGTGLDGSHTGSLQYQNANGTYGNEPKETAGKDGGKTFGESAVEAMGGGVSGLIDMALKYVAESTGLIGQIIVGVIQLLRNPEALPSLITALFEAVLNMPGTLLTWIRFLVRSIPDFVHALLAEFIPNFIVELPFIVAEVIMIIPALVLAIVDGIISLLTPSTWARVTKNLWEVMAAELKKTASQTMDDIWKNWEGTLGKAFLHWGDQFANSVGRGLMAWADDIGRKISSSLKVGGGGGGGEGYIPDEVPIIGQFAKGTSFIPNTGLALVHRGEAVIPAAQNPYNPAAAGAGAPINLNFYISGNYDAPGDIVRAIEQNAAGIKDRISRALTGKG